MRLYLIRHGQTHRNRNNDLIGQSPEEPLSTKGAQQAEVLGKRLKDEGISFAEVYCSPYDRARTTCQLALGIDVKMIIDERLREYSTGSAQDKQRHEMITEETLKRMMELGMHFGWPEGETLFEVEKRAAQWLFDVIQKHQDTNANIAAFSHGMTLKCLLHYILQFDHKLTWRMDINNTGISILDYKLNHWFIKTINDRAHLTKELYK